MKFSQTIIDHPTTQHQQPGNLFRHIITRYTLPNDDPWFLRPPTAIKVEIDQYMIMRRDARKRDYGVKLDTDYDFENGWNARDAIETWKELSSKYKNIYCIVDFQRKCKGICVGKVTRKEVIDMYYKHLKEGFDYTIICPTVDEMIEEINRRREQNGDL